MTKLSKPTIKNAWKKYQKGLEVVKDYRGKAKVLNEDQIEFIKQYFSNNRNFDKNVMNLHSEMIAYFGLNDKSFSFWTLYDYLEGLSFSYKKIIYKNNNANTTKVKDKRLETALKILGGHLQSLDFIYIDETSFNLETWPLRGWAPLGHHQHVTKPPKSKNYSAITVMDVSGILAVKILRGGVKGQDFFYFIKELVELENERFQTNKVVMLMDNASVHKSKDYMKKAENFYNVLYNAPYTPQFNPIEFAFSKIKQIVRKQKPKTEQDLVFKILNACKEITNKDAAKYIVHSLKFLDKAVERSDFF